MYVITFLHSQHLETHAGLFYSFKVDLLGKTKGPYPVEREGAFGKTQEGITPEFSLYAKVMVLFHWESNYTEYRMKEKVFWPSKNVYWISAKVFFEILNARNFDSLRTSERKTYLRSFPPYFTKCPMYKPLMLYKRHTFYRVSDYYFWCPCPTDLFYFTTKTERFGH